MALIDAQVFRALGAGVVECVAGVKIGLCPRLALLGRGIVHSVELNLVPFLRTEMQSLISSPCEETRVWVNLPYKDMLLSRRNTGKTHEIAQGLAVMSSTPNLNTICAMARWCGCS